MHLRSFASIELDPFHRFCLKTLCAKRIRGQGSRRGNEEKMVYSDDDQLLDRRENPRINWINSEVQVVIIPSNTEYKVLGWVLDISPGGFKVRTEVPQKVEQIFLERREIYFETSGDFFELKGRGRVIWMSSDWNTVGIRFDRLDEDSRKSLYGFLGRLAAD